MATNQLTLLRQWHMLHMIPRAPRKISVQEICDRLAVEEFKGTPAPCSATCRSFCRCSP